MSSSILRANNAIDSQGAVSWEALTGIDAGALTNASRSNFAVQVITNNALDKDFICICYYSGSGALTLTEFNNLPKGSIIHATGLTTPAMYYKTAVKGSAGFKYQVVNS